MAAAWTGDELRERPVCVRGIELGYPVELFVDAESLHTVGLAVRCGDGVVRFLPLAAARIRADEIEVRSAMMLLDESQTGFYRSHARPLGELRGRSVEHEARVVGSLADIVLYEDGTPAAVVLEGGRRLASPLVRIELPNRASAA